jgi:endonuclease/exonuclease/phosphatase (EEP) superfamily protein YafD
MSRAGPVGGLLLAAVWLVVLAFVGVVVLRFIAFDGVRYLAALNAQTLWLFLPVYAIASAAWCFRKYALATVATAVVLFQILSVVPSIGRPEAISAAARAAPRLRVLSANVRFSNPAKARLARELMQPHADVVLLQEITPGWLDVLDEAGFDDRYRYRVAEPLDNSRGMAVYSRLPLTDTLVVMPGLEPTISTQVTVGGTNVTLVDVHAVGPPEGMSAHRASIEVIAELARTRPRPRLVAGDFNATPYNKSMHRMEDLGLESAHRLRGRGLAVTWPNGKHFLPPIQLDHVLVDDALVVLGIRELRGSGSDHKPVLVDLAVMPPG